jgi:iron complex transport system substrate-binding protein
MERATRAAGRVAAAVAAAIAASTAAAADPPQRVVSVNLCADQLLLALADPEQIAALSIFAADPGMSYLADRGAAFPHDASGAETVVAHRPDLVLAGTLTRSATREMVARLGYRLVLLPPASTVDAAIAQVRQVAAAVGHPERGEALVAEIGSARERARALLAARTAPTAVIYERRGYVTGTATLAGDLLATVGFVNAGGGLAGGLGGFVPLERIVAEAPDFLVVASPSPRAEDQGSALLSHPALTARYPPERRIVLPQRLTVCGGPSLPAAFDWLAAEARRIGLAPSP